MKKVKVFKNVIEEIDLISEIVDLLDRPMPEEGYNFLQFNLRDLEYEDEDNIYHYASDMCKRCLIALNFIQDDLKEYKFTKNNYCICFKVLLEEGTLIIQRQS